MSQPAELLITGAVIHTLDPRNPRATEMAVRSGHIVELGTDLAHLRGPQTDIVDLGGASVMPGLLDVHNHHVLAGQANIFECGFPPSASLEQICAAVSEWSGRLEHGAWIVGGSCGSGLLPQLNSPEALAQLDEASNGHPAMLRDDSKHNRWANSAALGLAGITQITPDPAGGQILRDGSGTATGVLIEAGGILVERALETDQPRTIEDLARASERGIEILHSYGITGFQEAATSLQMMQAFKLLEDERRLKAWVVSSMQVNDFIFGTQPLGEGIIAKREEYRTVYHRPDFVKIFLDGVPPSHTAAFLEPYLPDAAHGDCYQGYTTMTIEELESWLTSTAGRDISAKIHCTGDASVRMVLDVVERVRSAGNSTTRFHIAHGQFVHDHDIARFGELDVTADISPALWFPGVIPGAIRAVLPEERAVRMQPNRSLLDAGARIAGGSDWPVSVSPNIWEAIYGLVTRRDPLGEFDGSLWPEQAVTLDEAIAMYTTSSAAAMGLDDVAGSLRAGKPADFVVLSANPYEIGVERLARVRAEQTWFAGERVYARGNAE